MEKAIKAIKATHEEQKSQVTYQALANMLAQQVKEKNKMNSRTSGSNNNNRGDYTKGNSIKKGNGKREQFQLQIHSLFKFLLQ